MLTVEINQPQVLKAKDKPVVFAVFSFRYDHELVPDMLENIRPLVDGWVSWDDRARTELWYNEGEVRNTLISAAREAGANWVLAVDPDERFEIGLKNHIQELISEKKKTIYGFPLREMYTPTTYRIDGIWGEKVQWRLISLFPDQKFMNQAVHSGWFPIEGPYEWIKTDFNLYHLKMINPKNRELRRDLYTLIHTEKTQEIGYDYLTDETGAIFEEIAKSRRYFPTYGAHYDQQLAVYKHCKVDGEQN